MDTARRLEIGPRRAHRHRRGVRLGRGRIVEGDRPPRAPLAVLGVEGGLRPHRALVPPHVRPAGRGDAVHEQLRAVPVPREGDPALHDQPARRRNASRSTATASTSATGSTSTTTARACTSRSTHGDAGRDLQHRRRQRDAEPRARRQAARAARQGRGRRSSTSPTASATTAATPSTSPRSPRSAGASSARSTKRSPKPSSGTATTVGGGSRSRRAA